MADDIIVLDASGSGAPPEIRPATPEEQAALDTLRIEGARAAQTSAFATADDTERLRIINERARTDPAYAALADIVLRGLSR